jgi:hypothetical protein
MAFSHKEQKQLRSIIKEYYGNIQYFAYNYAHNIYSIPEVRNAIEFVADVFSTIPMYHKRVDKSGNVTYLEDSLSRVLTLKPNPLQNATQFWKTVITDLLLDSNRFIEPIFSNLTGELLYLLPMPFRMFELSITNNIPYVTFRDSPNESRYLLDNLIYLNRFNPSLAGGVGSNLGLYETVIEALGNQIVNVASPKKVRALLQSSGPGQGQLKKQDRTGTMRMAEVLLTCTPGSSPAIVPTARPPSTASAMYSRLISSTKNTCFHIIKN